jgi:hypothetical protein
LDQVPRAERSALPEWRRSFGLEGLSLATIAWSLFVAGLFLGWIGGFGTHYVTLDIVDGECLMISLFSVVCVSFLKAFCRTLAVLAALLTLLLWAGRDVVVESNTRRAQTRYSLISNEQSAAQIDRPVFETLKPDSRNPKLETRNSKPGTGSTIFLP